MQSIPLTPKTVALFRKFVEHPEEYEGCDYKPIRECFEKSDTCTPQHILFNEYIAYLRRRRCSSTSSWRRYTQS